MLNFLSNLRPFNLPYSQPTNKIAVYALLVIVAVLISITGYQSYLLRTNDDPHIIARSATYKGLSDIVVSYRDTVLLDSVPDGMYSKMIKDIHLLKSGD